MNFSSIISGVMNWGVWGKNLNTSDMENQINLCVENQITTFDHADIYGGYTTEEDFGKAFQQTSIGRETVQLISKCGIKYLSEKRNYSIKHYDYAKDYILWSVDKSLQNLQTDYLDLLLLHRPSPLLNPIEVSEAISILKEKGKIKHFGVSNFLPHQTELLQKFVPVEVNQIQLSATHYKPMIDGQLDFMQLHQIIPMAWNPLGSVFREKTEQTRRLQRLLVDLTQKYNVPSEIILLKWLQKHPSSIIPVIGTTNENRILNLSKLEKFQLELEDWFQIWDASMGHKVP